MAFIHTILRKCTKIAKKCKTKIQKYLIIAIIMTETAQNLYKTGDKYHTDEDLKSAKKYYKLAIEVDPEHYDSLRWIADI